MPSIWERLGEGVGYGLAALVLGPPAALARRERRILRTAFAEWAAPLDATRLVSPALFTTRRLVRLAYPVEAELDAFHKHAMFDVPIPKLPPQARARISKDPTRIRPVKYRMTPSLRRSLRPLAEVDGIRADSKTIDAATAEALAREIATSALAKLEAFILEIDSERLVLEIFAPTSADEWKRTCDALVVFADSCLRRWESSYR